MDLNSDFKGLRATSYVNMRFGLCPYCIAHRRWRVQVWFVVPQVLLMIDDSSIHRLNSNIHVMASYNGINGFRGGEP